MNLYTADLHFGHKSLMDFDHRTFNDVDDMDKMMYVSDNGIRICLCHFSIAEWNGYYKGHSHIYGHIHNKKDETWEFMKTRKKAYNAGCMLCDYKPVSLNEIVKMQSIICK